MSSKIDFNILLARADKNTNNACKLLEEKKLLNQKSQQKNSHQRNELHKTAALAFIKQKKEEIRMRTEQEAKELLEKKHKKDQLESAAPKATAAVKKPTAKTAVPTNPHSTVKQVANKPSSAAVSKNLPNANAKSVAAASNSKAKPNEIKKPPGLPQTSGKSNLKNPNPPAAQNSQNQMKKIPKLSDSAPKLPAMSYDQMLKIADTFYKDKLTKTDNPKPEFKRADFSQIPLNGSSKNKKITHETVQVAAAAASVVLKKNATAVDAQKQQLSNPTTSNNQTRKPMGPPKSMNHPNAAVKSQKPQQVPRSMPAMSNLDTSKGMSSWDRIISDMKKKPVKNNVKKPDNVNAEPKQTYDEYEDDEYDSEMDDFIDDEEYDDNDNNSEKKDYSKCIQEIFNYNPKRYKTIEDDDLDDMETDYHSQLKEEKRSLKMGILEDLEELKKEAELEKKRLEKQKQKRKLEDEKNANIKKLKSNKT